MRVKNLDGYKINESVFCNLTRTYSKIIRIDGHVYPFCLLGIGRVAARHIRKLTKLEQALQ